jgi:hypothetical protein
MKLDFNDLLIVPQKITSITSRSMVNPFAKDYLPLMTAPMDTVIDNNNSDVFFKNKIRVCFPRGIYAERGFKSFSISEMAELVQQNNIKPDNSYLIDIANGHMKNVLELVKTIKEKYPNLKLMVGNIANPETFALLSDAGANYIRVGIGNGGGCILENSIVSTKSGDKPIQNVEIGDYVLTHTGEYKEVISTIAYPSREELIKINNTISTKTHEFYVLNKIYKDLVDDDNIHNYAEWIKAENLTNEFFLLEYDEND